MKVVCVAGIVASAAFCLAGCASQPAAEPHSGLEKRWGRYLSMPRQRAFAIAGDPDGIWVGSVVGGHRSPAEAERAALQDCERSRARRNIPGACVLYAVGHEIVWEKPVAGSSD
ncbi:MAG: hypothetical protein AAEJ52_05850 [Myxococcota bacterium]